MANKPPAANESKATTVEAVKPPALESLPSAQIKEIETSLAPVESEAESIAVQPNAPYTEDFSDPEEALYVDDAIAAWSVTNLFVISVMKSRGTLARTRAEWNSLIRELVGG